MARNLLRFIVLMLCGLATVSCIRQKVPEAIPPLMYDVRDVAVIAGPDISRALIKEVDQKVSDAISVTHRPVPMPRVVLTVTLGRMAEDPHLFNYGSELTFSVAVVSVDNGATISIVTFKLLRQDGVSIFNDQQLGEEVAARIRYAFSLRTPSVAPARRQSISTKLIGDSRKDVSPVETPSISEAKVEPVTEVAKTPVVEPVKPSGPPASSDLEGGAAGQIVIKPQAAAEGAVTAPVATLPAAGAPLAAGEPCVVTANHDCSPATVQ